MKLKSAFPQKMRNQLKSISKKIEERKAEWKGNLKEGDRLLIRHGWPSKEVEVTVYRPYTTIGNLEGFTAFNGDCDNTAVLYGFTDIIERIKD